MGRRRRKDKHLPERMYLRSGTYYFAEYGSNKWVNLGRNYPAAMAAYARLRGPVGPCKTVGDLIDRYMEEIAPTKATSTYQTNLKEARCIRGVFGRMHPESVRSRDIYAYLDERGKTSRTRANREVALLSHIFKYAIRWGYIDENPCIGVERYKEAPRQRYVEDAEYVAFKKHAGPFIAAYMDFKLITGLRQGDILRMRLDQLKDNGIHVVQSKTGKGIVIAWSDELRAAVATVKRLRRPVTGLYLFCTRKGQPYSSDGFRSIWQRKMVKALSKGVLRERFTEHDLRRKTGSDTSLQHATSLLAHSDTKITQRHYRAKPEVVKPLK